jgi:hypothetical protein
MSACVWSLYLLRCHDAPLIASRRALAQSVHRKVLEDAALFCFPVSMGRRWPLTLENGSASLISSHSGPLELLPGPGL